MEFKDRLRKVLADKNISSYRIAKETKISKATISNYLLGKTSPTGANIKLISDFLKVDIDWLLFGNGEILKYEPKDGTYVKIGKKSPSTIVSPAKPFVDAAYAVCGKPNGFNMAIMERDCEKLSIPFTKDYDFSIRAKGDSMINRKNPIRSIRQGDVIACKIINSVCDVRMGEIYALCVDGDIIIKKLAPSDKEGYIKCVSFNEEDGYYPFELSVDDIYGWAMVKCVASINLW